MKTPHIERLAKHIATNTGINDEKYLQLLIRQCFRNWVFFGWNTEDIHIRAAEGGLKISDEDARKVLHFLSETHNAEVGVNWDVIDCAIENVLNPVTQ